MRKYSRVDWFWMIFLPLVAVFIILASCTGLISARSLLEIEPSLAAAQSVLERQISTKGYTIDAPNVILDPYNAAPLTAVIAFETDELVRPTIKIAGKDEQTTLEFTFDIAKKHILPVYGLYADAENSVTISYGDVSREIKIKTAALPETIAKAEVKVADRAQLDNQLYFFTPSSVGYTCAYDINGDVRWYLSNYALWDNARLQNGHMLVSTERLLNTPYYMTGLYEIDMLGKIHAEYSLPGGYHHDYFELENGNLLIASDNFDGVNDTVEDYVVEMNRMTGEILRKYNLKEILPATVNTGNENWSSDDWFHNNAVWYDAASNSILLSGRHADAIVNIDYESGALRWILGDPTGWPEEYQHYFLKPKGKVEWQWSQHAVMTTPEGYVFLFDNGNNKSKIVDNYMPAERSYSRGVMYRIDDYELTVEQIWQYGKERGAAFYSPYISDVDYLEAGHYIVHSGGIVYKDGKNSNQPAGFGGFDKLVSDTVELIDDKVVFEIVLPTNTYRVEKMPAYTKSDYEGLVRGGAMRVGSLGKTEIAETKYGLLFGVDATELLAEHGVKITREEDRIVFSGTFKRNSNVRLVLKQGLEQKYYKLRITDKAHAAMCVAIFEEEENANEDDLTVTRYVNGEGLSGKYDLYLEVYDQIYDLGMQTSF